jgi:tryptophanyl-tRNA synthetase
MPGLDGQKMSKSYGNTITLREDAATVTHKVRACRPTRRAVRRTDPGDPERCPVWQLHQVYSDESTKEWVQQGCRSAGIGCIECKQPVIDGILRSRHRCANARRSISTTRRWCAHHCRWLRKGARTGARDHARRARGDGPQLLLK